MNYEEVKEKLNSYLHARIPFIIINSIEKNRILSMLKDINNDLNSNIYVHSMSKGMYNLQNNEIVSNEKTLGGILSFISNDIKDKKNVTYLLSDVDNLNEDNLITRFLYDVVNSCEEKSCSIIVISDKSVWPNLKRLGMNINLNFPNEKEIYNLLHRFIDKYNGQFPIEWDDNNFKEASVILLGLSESEIKNVISILIAKRSITKNDLTDLKFAKSKLFSNMEGLEKIETDNVVYGGLNNLKKWLNSKKKLLDVNNKEKLIKRGIKPPRGILVVGVPGCGKSLTAKAISKSWNLPLFLLDLATVQGMYVGQTEEQFKNALKTAEHVAPCVLWIDEIEKGLAGVNESSGVTSRMIGQFLFWLQECQKEVFVVATANDVESLPAELLRKGRFDEMFFVDLPNDDERKEIIEMYLNKYLGVSADETLIKELVTKSEGFASSDIESAIRDISYNIVADNIKLTRSYLIDYFDKCYSISKINPEKIDKIRQWGKGRTINAS